MRNFIALAFLLVSIRSISQNVYPPTGNVGIGTTTPGKSLEVIGDISLPSSSGNKQIYTWSPTDPNWRIGMSATPGFTTSMATSNVQYLTYASATGQGFALGVNGGQSSFEIAGSTHSAFFRGNVGVGTTTPNAIVDAKSRLGYNLYRATDQNNQYRWRIDQNFDMFLTNSSGNDIVHIGQNGSWFNSGNVGIGTAVPDAMLAVKGLIHAQEVKIDLLGACAPDYVFEQDYKLSSLDEIKAYIDQNKHLPEIPSAKEMEKNGVNLGEMNMLLLKKVEELTLHLIQTNERIDKLEKENSELKGKIK
jgi:hypothetical protein